MDHIEEHDLERYYLGMVAEPELSHIEEHLLWCHPCLDRCEKVESYVDAIRRAAIVGDFDKNIR
jgi:hypothetical protein